MKFHSPMIVVTEIARSKQFYQDVMQEQIGQDLDSYIVFEGGFSMMSQKQWSTLTAEEIDSNDKTGHDFELYFEEDALDDFMQHLGKFHVEIYTDLEEAPWGQRNIRILDPDGHVIEIAESMESVVKRFLSNGMSIKEVTEKSLMPAAFVERCDTELIKVERCDTELTHN